MSRIPIAAWQDLPETTRGYIVAVLTVAAAAVSIQLLRESLDHSIFILFAAPIALSAWYGGRAPAFAALVLGLFAVDVMFFDRVYGIVPSDPRDVVAMGVYILVGLVIVHLSDLLRSARDDARRYAQQLEDQAMELELQKAELEQQTQEAQSLTEELAEAHDALKETMSEQLAEAQSLARLGSWDWNVVTNTITWSDEMFRLYGIEPGSIEIDYERYQSLLHPDDRAIGHEIVGRSLQTGEPFSYDHRIIRPDGEERVFAARGRVILDDEGKPTRMFGTGQDVTEQRLAEAALRTAADLVSARIAAEQSEREALAASRAKSDFLARMSHELRTPLSAIIGYGELLADGITGPVNDEQKRQLNRIRSSANHLLAIIDEILTLARGEAAKEKVDIRPVDVGELMESVSTMAEPLASAKGLAFRLDVGNSRASIETDAVKLRQVLLNLISNAVKYTDRGSVTVASSSRNGEVDFVVKDTGVGVGEEHLEKIFEPFWQVEQTTTRRVGGTGLGLAVTRQFVDLLGGSIKVESRLGEGSSFTVTLPASADKP